MKKLRDWLRDVFVIVDQRSRKLLFLSSFLGFLWFGVELSFVYILQIFLLSLNLLSAEQLQVPSWFPIGILQSTVLLVAFGIVRSSVNYFKNYFSVTAQHSFIRSCRNKLIDQGLDSKIFLSSSEFLTLFSDRVNQSGVFIQYISLGLVTICSVFLFFIFGMFYAPKEMMFSLSLTILLMVPIKKITQRVQTVGESLINEWTEINEKVLVTKRNMFFLAVYDLIDFKKKEIKKNLEGYEKHYISYASVSSFFSSVPLFVGVSVLSLTAFLSIEHFHTPGVKVLSFFYIFLRLVQGLSELNTTFVCLKLTHPYFKSVRDTLVSLENSERLGIVGTQQLSLNQGQLAIALEEIAFAYPNSELLYENLSMEISGGDVLIIKGASGAGKSTLLKLLLGIEKPTYGRVLINQKEVGSLDPRWRLHLGYVGPDPFLVKGTVKENLEFGNYSLGNLKDEDYWSALKLAGLTTEFKLNQIDLDTMLSELSSLSTGQKQRLAIARAFLRRPSILILDEATANLDADTERQIVDNLKELSSSIATIIVTHKNSFDRVGTKFITIGN